jgi:integrase
MVEKYLSDWQGKPLAWITSDLILDKHKALHKAVADRKQKVQGYSGETTADGVIRLVRALWNFAADTDLIPDLGKNPTRILSKTKSWYRTQPQPRTRSIPDAELAGFWAALNAAPAEIVPDGMKLMTKMLLLTGLRIGTVRQLRWEHVDLTGKVLHLAAGILKGKRPLDLPIPDPLQGLLSDWHAQGVDSYGWMFPSVILGKHLVDVRPAFSHIAETTKQTRYSPHDLRRTFATAAYRCGLGELDIAALLHHRLSGSVTAGYIVTDVEQLRRPMQSVADRLMALCEPSPVIQLAKHRRAKR